MYVCAMLTKEITSGLRLFQGGAEHRSSAHPFVPGLQHVEVRGCSSEFPAIPKKAVWYSVARGKELVEEYFERDVSRTLEIYTLLPWSDCM